ncbi:VOC family protein [Cytobacillus oceanisediminis]|uniref:Methylmalonyl-CoA/ethylmalonyl-CoA epimerase n=1 Tax=Cytobacillus oceanisediminis TaxID=665099 RepID=A0A562JRN0_9BACI|nr:VOC family protein [Cytobacillus oceanisediminis]TWH85850.1 methylmalonyl-CoA/ethylmalonyl-CoA epimerase [Cytobacillus oceanisediminis]
MASSIDHIVIAVKDLEKSKQLFSTILKGEFLKEMVLPEQNARAAYFLVGGIVIGLETPLSEKGDIHNFLERRGEGLHHIAFNIDEIDDLHSRLLDSEVKVAGFKKSHGLRKELFTHPKSSFGLLLQLIEWEQPFKESLEKRIETL